MDAVDRQVKAIVGNQAARAYGFRAHHDYEPEDSEGQGDDADWRQPSASALPHPEDTDSC